MKKNKSKQVDLLYVKDEKKKEAGKKRPAKRKEKPKKEQKAESDIFSFDDEIVIGVTKIEDKPKKKEKDKKEKESKKNKNKKKAGAGTKTSTTGKKNKKAKNYKNAKEVEEQLKKRKKIAFVLKICALLVVIAGTVLFMLLSPTFDVTKITVKGNEKITNQEIISLSGITLEENTFKYRLSQISENVESQSYIESAKVARKLPSEIVIEVIERKPSFMLELGNAYVYMSSQGYFLEISETKLELPIIVGYETKIEDIQPGNRFINADLEKLETALRIMKYASANQIAEKITQINIANKNEYVLRLETEKKTVYLGDASYLEKKMQYLVVVLENETNVEAEVFLNVDINTENFYVREQV